MKRSALLIAMTVLLFAGSFMHASGQDQPKLKKDTVNMDTYAKPKFYYAVEDEKGGAKKAAHKNSAAVIGIIAGVVVVAGITGFFLLRKKK
jgi:hypothetical protein